MSERVPDPPSPYAGYVSYGDYSRLAARVAELEARKKKLLACVKAATKIRKFRMPESVVDLHNAAISDEWEKLTIAYDAARAEVDNG